MPQPIHFTYYLRVKNGVNHDYYSLDNVGNVVITTSATPTNPIQFAPDGWFEQMLNWERKFVYYGVYTEYSVPMKFVKDGAKIIRNKYINEGIEAVLELYIEKFNVDASIWVYQPFYAGDLDFSTYDSQRDYVSITAIQGGFLSKLAARETTNYEYDVENSVGAIWVKMHGINLQYIVKWVGLAGSISSSLNRKVPTLISILEEGTNLALNTYTQDLFGATIELITNTSATNQTIYLTYDYAYNITIPITEPAATFFLEYLIIDSTNTIVSTITITSSTTQASGTSQNYIGLALNTIILPPNHRINAVIRMYVFYPTAILNPASYIATDLGSNKLKLSISTKIPESYIPALRAGGLYQALISDINDGEVIFPFSNMLNFDHANKVITSGDALRNLPNSKMRITFDDLFSSVNAIFNASFRYEKQTNRTYLEYKADVYQNVLIADLGEVSDVDIKPFTQEMFSKLTMGYGRYTYDEVNGKDEANTETEYLGAITKVILEKKIVSPIRSDVYGTELTRLNLAGKEITDAESDNENFWLHIKDAPSGTIPVGYQGAGNVYFELERDPAMVITNVFNTDTLYNIFFSPKRCLFRWGNWLKGLFHNLTSKYIKFQVNGKNNATGAKMVTTLGTVTIDEGADELIANLDSALFIPITMEFKTKVQKNLYSIMNSNPYGYIRIVWKGNEYFGYVLKASQEPSTDKPQTFKILLTASNNISNLIY